MYCAACLIEGDGEGVLHDEHSKDYDHHDYGDQVPIVNVTRFGVYDYVGPANPPYGHCLQGDCTITQTHNQFRKLSFCESIYGSLMRTCPYLPSPIL